MRFLCIDLGDKRTGLAAGDDVTRIVSEVGVIERPGASEALLDEIARAVEEYGPDEIVVGLALNMDGTEGARAKMARAFGERLGARLGLPIHYQDERLSTEAARWEMAGSGLTRKQKKGRKDSVAAAGILREFLRAHGERRDGG